MFFTLKNKAGMTLIEVLIVVAMIGLLFTLAVPTVSNIFGLSQKSAIRDLATKAREAFHSTVISGSIHRIVYDITNSQFWVERGPQKVLLDSDESREKDEQNRSFFDEEKEDNSFSMAKRITSKKISLPSGVIFQDIITQQNIDPVTEGVVYTHFFPHGIIEQTLIHILDSNGRVASLVIEPIAGYTRLYQKLITKEEAFD